ncbi:MAG: cobalt-precorrin-5B (C(1))-methyltransferase CbiD [Candidatus Scalindua sp.]|nr:cobalt-precorrin-5B (C(1))-methyltransferase CbiD [Candidatus Scalindua sp.]
MKYKYGFTTGSCAAGAAKGAAYGLYRGSIPDSLELSTPAGILLRLRLAHRKVGSDFAECAVRKYSGDDPDVTNGCEVHVRVERLESSRRNGLRALRGESQAGVKFTAGEGVGIVTRPGLQIGEGEPAINPVPRSMIQKEIGEILGDCNGVKVSVSVPGGEELARKTFNERLGIIGGISIIGTSGIVKPMSLDSFKVSLVCELDVAHASGYQTVVLVPGGIGESVFLSHFSVSRYQVVQMSNFIGFMLDEAVKHSFQRIVLAGHPGKLAKIIRGDFYTHSSGSKPANDILLAICKSEKVDPATIGILESSPTVDGMVEILKENGKLDIFDRVARDVQASASRYIAEKNKISVVLFDMKKNIIGVSEDFRDWEKSL